MRAPNFWNRKGILSFILYPFSFLYSFCYDLRCLFASEYSSKSKIICVGNINLGGSGKTPIVIKIAKILKENNKNFAILTRGYKGNIEYLTKVNKKTHTAVEVGDEALLLAEYGDTYVCKSKKSALEELDQKNNYDFIVIDDGLQNPTFVKDKSILVIDGEYGFGNNFIFPAGPLREKIESITPRIGLVIIVGQDKFFIEDYLISCGKSVLRAKIVPLEKEKREEKYIAFAGIGRPDKFFDTLILSGYNIIEKFYFGDHHFFSEEDINNLISKAKNTNSKLITTKKDWLRLNDDIKKQVEFLDIEIKFYNEESFEEFVFNE